MLLNQGAAGLSGDRKTHCAAPTTGSLFCICVLCCGLAGCGFVPTTQLTAAQTQNKTLTEQLTAQQGELENLKFHTRSVENQLVRAEADLARVEQVAGTSSKQLTVAARDRSPAAQYASMSSRTPVTLSTGMSSQLAQLSRRFPSLQFDGKLGVARFDADLIFDSGDDHLKPDAEAALTEFARILQADDGKKFRVLVAGHTDNQKLATREVRDQFHDNWQLSTSRAHSVADFLRRAGVSEDRMGVAGFGGHQPIASNETPESRRRNRRVEIFVVSPDTPVVGWTESTPELYETARRP